MLSTFLDREGTILRRSLGAHFKKQKTAWEVTPKMDVFTWPRTGFSGSLSCMGQNTAFVLNGLTEFICDPEKMAMWSADFECTEVTTASCSEPGFNPHSE